MTNKQMNEVQAPGKDAMALIEEANEVQQVENERWSRQGLEELANAVERYTDHLPTNNEGTRLAYIDPSVVLEHIKSGYSGTNRKTEEYTKEDDIEILEDATVALDLSDGFPAVDGRPVWERLDCEPMKYYKPFKDYRDQIKAKGTRNMKKASEKRGMPVGVAKLISRVYQWDARLRAFDKHLAEKRNAEKSFAIREMSNKHKKAAERIFQVCSDFLMEHQEELTPKTALKWLKTSVELERLSLGMKPDSPDAPKGNTPEYLSQTLIVNQGEGKSGNDVMESVEQQKLQDIVDILETTGTLDKAAKKSNDATDKEIQEVTDVPTVLERGQGLENPYKEPKDSEDDTP